MTSASSSRNLGSSELTGDQFLFQIFVNAIEKQDADLFNIVLNNLKDLRDKLRGSLRTFLFTYDISSLFFDYLKKQSTATERQNGLKKYEAMLEKAKDLINSKLYEEAQIVSMLLAGGEGRLGTHLDLLLEAKCNVSELKGIGGCFAQVVSNSSTTLCAKLLAAKIDPNSVDQLGSRALHYVSLRKKYKETHSDAMTILRLLLEHKADVNSAKSTGDTPLDITLQSKDFSKTDYMTSRDEQANEMQHLDDVEKVLRANGAVCKTYRRS